MRSEVEEVGHGIENETIIIITFYPCRTTQYEKH